jgi:hypothetical protein
MPAHRTNAYAPTPNRRRDKGASQPRRNVIPITCELTSNIGHLTVDEKTVAADASYTTARDSTNSWRSFANPNSPDSRVVEGVWPVATGCARAVEEPSKRRLGYDVASTDACRPKRVVLIDPNSSTAQIDGRRSHRMLAPRRNRRADRSDHVEDRVAQNDVGAGPITASRHGQNRHRSACQPAVLTSSRLATTIETVRRSPPQAGPRECPPW